MEIERNFRLFIGKVPVIEQPAGISPLPRAAGTDLGLFRDLNAHIAVLDGAGMVAGENKPWHEFVPKACKDFPVFYPGTHYMETVMKWAPRGQEFAAMAPGIQRVMAGDLDRFDLIYAIKSNGCDIWLQVEITPFPPGVLVFHKDITETRRKEQHHQQANKMEAIGTLAGGIAHDFNNILAGIIGYSELIKEDIEALGGVDEKTHERLDNVIGASMRAKDLIHQILTFSRFGQEEKHPISVNSLVKEVAQFLRASLPATIQIQQSLYSESLVIADPTHIHQILMNLCANARDAMGAEGGILSIRLEDVRLSGKKILDADRVLAGEFVRLSVGDTGTGIQPEILGKIMEPFFTTKPKEKGTGMGLAVVHGIVRGLEGGLFVSDRRPNGTWVDVYLPLHGKNLPADKKDPGKESVKGGTEHIIFVDDEVALTQIARDSLANLGYQVSVFSDSMAALADFKEDPGAFDLVISDITMPVLPGDALVREMRRIRPDIPVILITGASERMDPDRAEQMGINALLYKPMISYDLAATIRRVLDGKH
ncbi:MAG: response regulator [Proteobacteria bacterium]|nr:response regulator [Desulfobacula sp.]MBU3950655.1 response regulator [Pseudomonadota bacterium]MBU4132492.1 response regulator [Pseudomonadota bacterium]